MRSRKRRPFYLVSSAGVPNYGDEFITRAWLDWLARNHPTTPVWLDCIEPGRANHLFAGAHPRLRTTNTLWHLALAGAGAGLDDGAERTMDQVANLGSPRFDLGLMELRQARSVHLLGGGYLNSVWEHQLLLLPALIQLKRSHGIPIYATGQGLAPLNERATELLPGWIHEFDLFETRDAPSATLLGTDRGVDDAFLAFATKRPVYSSEKTPDLMILVQGDFVDEAHQDALLDAVTSFIHARRPSGPVGIVESLPPDDSWILPRLAERGVATEFYPFVRLWTEGFPARQGQEWLSTRFHFHLLAAAEGAAGAVLDLHPDYYGIKHASLRELGTGWSLTNNLDALPALLPSVDKGLRRRRLELARSKARVARQIYG